MASGPLQEIMREEPREVTPTVLLWDLRDYRLKPEGLEIATIRFDHMAKVQHWNSVGALKQIQCSDDGDGFFV